jgi:hypothetical protein
MADKTDTAGQPTLEKLGREGVSIRKCIAMGESYGGDGGGSKAAKSAKQPGLATLAKRAGY